MINPLTTSESQSGIVEEGTNLNFFLCYSLNQSIGEFPTSFHFKSAKKELQLLVQGTAVVVSRRNASSKHNCLTCPPLSPSPPPGPLFCTVTQSTLMAGIAAQLLGIVSDDNSYQDNKKGYKLVVLSFCYASLCLNLLAPISTIFFLIRLGSMSVDEIKHLSAVFNKIRWVAVPFARLKFETMIVAVTCEFLHT